MKTETKIIRYTPASDDGHPAILVASLKVDAEIVFTGEEAEVVKAQIERGESPQPGTGRGR